MQFDAYSISSVVKKFLIPAQSGSVHSVFRNAINIAFDHELIGITRHYFGNSPFNLLLDNTVSSYFDTLWKIGDSVWVQENQLIFSNKISIRLDTGYIWNPYYVLPKNDMTFHEYILADFLDKVAMLPEKGIFWPLFRLHKNNNHKIFFLLYFMNCLIDACKNHDETSIAEVMPLIIGCGEGLTPSGDDFICGFVVTLIYATKCTVLSTKLSNTIECLLKNFDYHKKSTTWLSQMMLKGAVKGWIIEPAIEMIANAFTGKISQLNIFSKMWAIGHNSGADMTTGIYHALKVISHDQIKLT